MKQTKTVWDGEKFAEISDAQTPAFLAACHAREKQRTKTNARIMFAEAYTFFAIPAMTLFLWFVAHWFCAPDNAWFAFGQNYAFCVLPACVMLIGFAKAWYDSRPYRPE